MKQQAFLAFYVGVKKKNKNSTFVDNAICKIDGSDYSHVEFAVLQPTGNFLCYSSSNRDGGARSKVIDLRNGSWMLKEIDVDVKSAIEIFEKFRGCKYDYLGLGSTRWEWFPNIPNRVFCSELVSAMIGRVDFNTTGVKDLATSVGL